MIRNLGRMVIELRVKFLLTFFLIFLSGFLFAQKPIPELWGQRVHDEANVLKQETIESLEQQLKIFEDSTSNQIALLIIPSLEGEPIETYTLRVAEKWKLGTKLKDNGVLFLIAVEDHQMRIEVGQGLQGVLTDAQSSRIIRNEVAPNFRRNDYNEGVISGINAIQKAIAGEYKSEATDAEDNTGWIIFGIVFGLGCIGLLIYSFATEGNDVATSSSRPSPNKPIRNSSSSFDSSSNKSSFSGRGGSFDGGGSSGSW